MADQTHPQKRAISTFNLSVYTFYKFLKIEEAQIEDVAGKIQALGDRLDLEGLVIFGREGINATISGLKSNLDSFMCELETRLSSTPLELKESLSDFAPFKNFKVKVRTEIVSLGKPDIQPNTKNNHLSPKDWHQAMKEDDVMVLDTRNWYETKIGKFEGAIDPNIDEFNEFPEYLKNSNISKTKKLLIYCTGGIRCEKAIIEMQEQGFENVFQLDGGILKYIEEFPNEKFTGECFVFDHRVAVDQKLYPTQNYKMCPHCGQPSGNKISCRKCESDAWICETCEKDENLQTCSKNCAHHYRRNPLVKGRKQFQGHRYEVIKRRGL